MMASLDSSADAGRSLPAQVLPWLAAHGLQLLAALLILAGGWLLASWVRRALRLAGARVRIATVAQDDGASGADSGAARSLQLLGAWLYWLIVALFAAWSIQSVGGTLATAWPERLAAYVPGLAVGVAIIAAGILLGGVAGRLVARWLAVTGAERAAQIARAVQVTIATAAVLVGLDQIGIHMMFLMTLVAIGAGAVAAAFALAFALGAAGLVRNLIGARGLRRYYEVGQTVRINELQGEIVDIGADALVLLTSAGRVTIPARVFGEVPITLVSGTGNG